MKPYHIALVEDDADDREFISLALQQTYPNMELDSFKTGTEFLNYLSTATTLPELVVTDIRMPIISGFEVIQKIKLREDSDKTTVVVLSTSGNEEDVERATNLGASAYYIKPCLLSDYCKITKEILEELAEVTKSEVAHA